MEKAGRRPLLIWPMGVMTGSFILLTIFLNLMDPEKHPDLVVSVFVMQKVCTYLAVFDACCC